MRLKKLSLVAAASFGFAAVAAANTTAVAAGGSLTVSLPTGNYDLGAKSTLTIDALTSSTYSGRITGSGDVVKTGSGILQINSYADISYYNGVSFLGSGGPTADDFLLNATTGSLRVKQGGVMVSGYLNQWADFGMLVSDVHRTGLPAYKGDDQYLGYSSIVLEGNSSLSVRNAPLNVSAVEESYDGFINKPVLPGARRVVYLRNLKAGEGHNQALTQLDAGGADTSVIVHITSGETGSIGNLVGSGKFVKTGAGSFSIINESRFTGDVLVGGGVLVLDGESGGTLASARTVNIGLGGVGAAVASKRYTNDYMRVDEWRPGYVAGAGDAVLRVNGVQTINNFQALFGTNDKDYLAGDGRLEPFGVTTGTGSTISFRDADSVLVLNQQMDAYYTGAITGGGSIVKQGNGTLALHGATGSYKNLTVRNGALISNVQMLGGGSLFLGDAQTDAAGVAPSLVLIQNDAGTLRAKIYGNSDGELVFKTKASITNSIGASVGIGNGQIGSVDIFAAQSDFRGSIVAEDGLTLAFNAASSDAFANAKAVILRSGANGEETTLTFNDTVQTLRNFQGDAGTRISLGRGTATLVQSGDLDYAGKITGIGNLIKDGAGTLVLSGRDSIDNAVTTYGGATVVRGGKLALASRNQLPNTSALVLTTGGTIVVNGDQHFGALFGQAGTVLNMGAGNLTIGVTDDRLAQIRQEAASLPQSVPVPNAGYYLQTQEGVTGLPDSISVANTKAFLQSAGLSAAEADALSFAGVITGSGDLVKIGAERLTLTGANTYTGATRVLGGTLQVTEGSIALSSSIVVEKGASLAVDVAETKTGFFDMPVSGAGSFSKTGAGTLTLGKETSLTGGFRVDQGTLVLAMKGGFGGDLYVASGATLNYSSENDATLAGVFSGAGTFTKEGASKLVLSSSFGVAGFTGDLVVNGGSLVSSGLAPADIAIAAGATYRADLASAAAYAKDLSGAGTLAVDGASLNLLTTDKPGPASGLFTGTLAASNTSLIAGTDHVLSDGVASAGSLLLTNARFQQGATNQRLAGLSGDAFSVVSLGGGTLTVAPASDRTVYEGTLEGSGTLVKTGAGTLTLASFANTGWTGTTLVEGGTLEATPMALGASAVSVVSGGKLALRNPDAVNAMVYANAITGDGVIGKTGAGVVSLTNGSGGFTGTLDIAEGELRAATGNIGGQIFPKTTVAKGATYAVVLGSDTTHDATADYKVSGAGSLAVEGAYTLKLVNGQSYTGNTILRSGATLDLTDATFSGTLLGLAGQAGTVVRSTPSLVIDQNTDGVFAGKFESVTDLTVKGAGKFAYSKLTNVGTVAIDGGNLAVDASLTKAVVLSNGGTLYFDTTGSRQVYQGAVTGSGDMVKTGTGDLVLTDTAAFANAGAIGVDQGKLTITTAGLGANITGLKTSGTGTLALDVAAGSTDASTFTGSASRAITGPGALTKTGSGKLVLGTAANPYAVGTTGTLTVAQGTLGGTFTTSGALVVGKDGTLAPGNSPGTVTVNGAFSSFGSLALELNATASDLIAVNGFATLANGTKFLVTHDPAAAAPVRGQGYTVLTATSGVLASEGDFTLDPASRRVIIVTPLRNGDAAGSLYGKGAANAIVVYDVMPLAETPGYSAHEGLSGMLGVLDSISVDQYGMPANAVAAQLAFIPTADLARTVNALSPLGFGSLYAMERDTALRHEDRIRERLEQRRYDQGGYSPYEWEAFVVGGAAMADNEVKTDTPTFDTRTYGGLVGLDKKLDSGMVVGGAAGYDNGSATLHQSAGKVDMNRVRGTAFLSTRLTNRWFLDAGLSGGFGDFATKRNTLTGRVTGSTTGVDVGANVFTGTIVTLNESLHLTPFAGVSYAHHEFQGFTEKGGNGAAFKVDSWSNDSLRASVGTGLGWWIPSGDWKWKLGVDASFNHELLDTESDIDARFAAGGSKFSTTAAALPADSLSVGPNAALHFDENNAISGGVNFEYGFDGRTYTGFNVAFRRRF